MASDQQITSHRAAGAVQELPLIMSDDVAAQIRAMGRTEDVVLSPDGCRLAVAAFNNDEVVLIDFDVEHDPSNGRPSVVLVRAVLAVGCELMARPHGVAWLDDTHLLVGNREAEVLMIEVPESAAGRQRLDVEGRVMIDGACDTPVSTPGSITAVSAGPGLTEVLVCNNYVHNVSRHVLQVDSTSSDAASGASPIVDAERLLEVGLELPDGVDLSASRDWLAISNHNTHAVKLYPYDEHLDATSAASGEARQVNYPHALRFTDCGRFLLVADAGLPFVHVYEAPDGDWSGIRHPSRSLRVMNDATFHAARSSPQEGGPKGLEVIDRHQVVAVTSAAQPLAFFDLIDFIDEPVSTDEHTMTEVRRTAEATSARRVMSRIRRRSDQRAAADAHRRAELNAELHLLQQQLADLKQRLDQREMSANNDLAAARHDAARLAGELEALRASTAWRITAPLRRIADRLHR